MVSNVLKIPAYEIGHIYRVASTEKDYLCIQSDNEYGRVFCEINTDGKINDRIVKYTDFDFANVVFRLGSVELYLEYNNKKRGYK